MPTKPTKREKEIVDKLDPVKWFRTGTGVVVVPLSPLIKERFAQALSDYKKELAKVALGKAPLMPYKAPVITELCINIAKAIETYGEK